MISLDDTSTWPIYLALFFFFLSLSLASFFFFFFFSLFLGQPVGSVVMDWWELIKRQPSILLIEFDGSLSYSFLQSLKTLVNISRSFDWIFVQFVLCPLPFISTPWIQRKILRSTITCNSLAAWDTRVHRPNRFDLDPSLQSGLDTQSDHRRSTHLILASRFMLFFPPADHHNGRIIAQSSSGSDPNLLVDDLLTPVMLSHHTT